MYQILCYIFAGLSGGLAAAVILFRSRARVFYEALDLAVKAADGAKAAAGSLGDLARFHERRASEYFGLISDIEKERDGWQKFYRESSMAAGVAQAWLMRDLQRAIQEANNRGVKLQELGHKALPIQADPMLVGVLEGFEVHSKGQLDVPGAPAMEPAMEPPKHLA